ncbi:MAG: hypothetical protein ACI841_002413 [Planctomycetota bacterium]|jgi:hypothetical protein
MKQEAFDTDKELGYRVTTCKNTSWLGAACPRETSEKLAMSVTRPDLKGKDMAEMGWY